VLAQMVEVAGRRRSGLHRTLLGWMSDRAMLTDRHTRRKPEAARP
jgi:hypothetical protein